MKQFYIGLDGGGTKTAVCVFNQDMQAVAEFSGGAINCTGRKPVEVKEAISEIFTKLGQYCGSLKLIKSVCVGAAGVSSQGVTQILEDSIRGCGYNGKLQIVGDHVIALVGALGRTDGMVLIAGTGSICYGRTHENGGIKEWRTGGWGHLIDDVGSGYYIGRCAATAVVRTADGRGEPTILTELIYDQLKIQNTAQLLRYIYNEQGSKKDLAALAPLLDIAVERNDLAAIEIAKLASGELIDLVFPVAKMLSMESSELAICGSILQKSEIIKKMLVSEIAKTLPNLQCIMPRNSAANGAAIMAAEACEGRM